MSIGLWSVPLNIVVHCIIAQLAEGAGGRVGRQRLQPAGAVQARGVHRHQVLPAVLCTVDCTMLCRILKHPEMSNTRLSDDIALLYTDRDINLDHAYVNTACLPGCEEQFNHQFHNGTGARCWVAGWGKDEFEGSFQFIPRKVDLPLVAAAQCEPALRAALDRREAGTGARFSLHHSELCAGGEPGKDACTGDGGSPLVCQAQSGRWTLVGLVAWGVGCASETPGVYVNVAHFRDWINAN